MKRETPHQNPSHLITNNGPLQHPSFSGFLSPFRSGDKNLHKLKFGLRKLKMVLFLALYSFLLGYSPKAVSQGTPVVTVRFANPSYDCFSEQYCVDVEFHSNTADVQVFGMNVRFFYADNILEFISFSDYQGGYGPVAPNPPTVLNSPFAGPALFNFVGSADFVNGAIQLTNPLAPPIIISTVGWTKLFQICFDIDDPAPDIASFCPSLVWDLEVNPADGGFLAGDDGVVITQVDPTLAMESLPTDENVVQFNWMYSGPGTPPYGMPIEDVCISIDCSPMIMCAVDTTIECDESTLPPNTGVATATDICAGDPVITFSDIALIPGNCPNNFTINRRWIATNACDLADTCFQLITVIDTTAPDIVCPGTITVQCANQVPEPDPASVGATDNCGGTVTVTFVDDAISNQTCVNRYTITRTYRATDVCNNSATCNQTINVFDNMAPELTCPGNVTVQCANQVPDPDPGSVTSTDNCGGTATITHVGDEISGQTCANRFTITRTYRATDECNNSATCNQTINVFDDTAPGLTCPGNITVQCASEVPAPDPASITATDNCGGTATVTHVGDVISDQTCANRFTVTRTYMATDECNNSATCNQIIDVFDNMAPMLTCPSDVTIECTASTDPGGSNGMLTATDNCGGGGALPEVWINEFHYDNTGTDAGEFIEVAGPAGTDLSIYSLVLYNGNGGTVYTTTILAGIIPNQSNGFGTVPFPYPVNGIQNGSPDGIALVKNAAVIQFLSYEGTFVAVGGPANGLLSVDIGVLEFGSEPLGLSLSLIGNGNMYGNFTWSGPSAESPGLLNPGQTILPLVGGPSITYSDVTMAGACPQEYTITRTWRATDACNNSATCDQTITVDDSVVPELTCPSGVTVECASQVPPPDINSVTASDNCGGTPTISFVGDVVSEQTCANRFTVTRTYRATDACNNSATCNQTISVFDQTGPSLTCPGNVTVSCASQVPPVNPGGVTATDNCGGSATVTHAGDVISGQTCANRFTLTRTYQGVDACGNTSTCAQIILVNDVTPPSITCPAGVTVSCANQVPAVNTGSVTTSDNCGGTATVTHVGDVITNQTCVNRFTLTRTYRSTDACGNSATCNQIISVNDQTPPTISCPAGVTVTCANQVPPVNTGSVTTSDNCGGTATVTHVGDVITNQTCVNRFTLTRTYRSTDACGNSATCTQVISVFDNIAPVITITDPRLAGVPNGGTVNLQCYGQDPEWEFPEFDASSATASDNCGGNVTVTFSQTLQDEGNCAVDGYIALYRLTWTATDACGNSSSKFVFFALVDDIPPVIHGVPDDITVNCDEIPDLPTNIFATDECLCACIILFNQSSPAPGCQNGQVITRSWKARDDCGNETTEVQNITLVDLEGPALTITVPELSWVTDGAVLNYTCNEGGIPDYYDLLNGESIFSPLSCGTTGIISFDKEIDVSNNCKFWGYIEQRTFHWKAVDLCGNETNLTLVARLLDTEPPVLIGVPEMACIGDPALKEVDAIDNCGHPFVQYWDVRITNPCGNGTAYRRTYEAYDDCGNYTRQYSILIPNDQTDPVLKFVNPVLEELEPGEVLLVDCAGNDDSYTSFGPEDVRAEDGCTSGVTVHFTETVLERSDCSTNGVLATLSLEWTATDICGNVSVLTVQAHVVDQTSPVFDEFMPEMTVSCDERLPDFSATDNCGDVSISVVEGIIPGNCPYEYDMTRFATATDPCGNSTTVIQIVHVGDGSGPIIEGVEEEVCDDLSIPEVTAFDPCSGEFVEVSMTEHTLDVPSCHDGIVVERIWSAVNVCGHTTEIRQLIVVGDKTPPELLIPSWSIIRRYLDVPGRHLIYLSETDIIEQLNALDDGSVTALDDCDQQIIPEFSVEISYADNCKADGYFERRVYTWIATDVCGNSTSISFSVDIMDDLPPVFTDIPDDVTIICAPLPSPPVVHADDPAQPVSIVYSESIGQGDGPGVFVVTRRWVATDACGNVTVAVQHISWIPDTFLDCDILLPGMVECNSHGVIIGSNVTGGLGDITYLWEVIGEKCFIQSGQGTPEITIYVGWTEVQIKLTVTDAFGCTTMCTATLDCIGPGGNNFIGLPVTTNPLTKLNPEAEKHNPGDDPVPAAYLTELNLWPNPANETLNVNFDSYANHEIQFTMFNLLGQIVRSNVMDAHKGFNTHKIDVSGIPEGSYMIELKTEKEMYSKVIIVLHNN